MKTLTSQEQAPAEDYLAEGDTILPTDEYLSGECVWMTYANSPLRHHIGRSVAGYEVGFIRRAQPIVSLARS